MLLIRRSAGRTAERRTERFGQEPRHPPPTTTDTTFTAATPTHPQPPPPPLPRPSLVNSYPPNTVYRLPMPLPHPPTQIPAAPHPPLLTPPTPPLPPAPVTPTRLFCHVSTTPLSLSSRAAVAEGRPGSPPLRPSRLGVPSPQQQAPPSMEGKGKGKGRGAAAAAAQARQRRERQRKERAEAKEKERPR